MNSATLFIKIKDIALIIIEKLNPFIPCIYYKQIFLL